MPNNKRRLNTGQTPFCLLNNFAREPIRRSDCPWEETLKKALTEGIGGWHLEKPPKSKGWGFDGAEGKQFGIVLSTDLIISERGSFWSELKALDFVLIKIALFHPALPLQNPLLSNYTPTPLKREAQKQHMLRFSWTLLCCVPSLKSHLGVTENPLNKVNFLELFKFVSKYAPEIETQLKELPRNATLMNHHIQDELLEAAASVLLRKIKAELHGLYFAILADEYKDLAKWDLVAVCVWFIHGGVINEQAVGFVEAMDLSAQGLSRKILEVLRPLELDPTLCVGFCFDKASVMLGHTGVQAVLRENFPKAIYLHCNSHQLNLVLCSAAKESGHVSTFFDTVNQIHSFFTGAQWHAWFIRSRKKCTPTVWAWNWSEWVTPLQGSPQKF